MTTIGARRGHVEPNSGAPPSICASRPAGRPDAALAALGRANPATNPAEQLTPLAVDRFARAMRERLAVGDFPFRKVYVGSILDRIEVDHHAVLIMGRKEVLEQAVMANERSQPLVHGFVPSWRPRLDSNQRPPA